MSTLTIWAHDGTVPSGGLVALWQAFLPDDAPEGWHSLPEEVHEHRESLRADYLSWLHGVGVSKVRGKALVDRMAIRQGLSYWWMTIPADNSLESNSPAYIAVRLMALAALADRLGVTSVRIATSDRSLARLLRDWAKATGRHYEVLLDSRPRLTKESLYRAFPLLAALRVIIGHAGIPRRVKRKRDEPASGSGQSGICLVDYLAHFSPGAVEEGRFASNYWGPLVQVLDELNEPVRWLHISADLASTGVVTSDDHLVDRFDEDAAKQTHDLLHRHLTWAVLIRSCRDYLRVRCFGLTARPRARLFADASSGTSMWQAFRAAYRDQFFGKTAMLNCLWLNLFEEALKRMPPQRLGIYLFENQPWEMSFIHAWRGAGHGELIGVAHSTTRFWDTRYFRDPRDLWDFSRPNSLRWPDKVAVNGPAMWRTCQYASYPEDRVVNVEAQRFLDTARARGQGCTGEYMRVLLLGEYSHRNDEHLLNFVADATSRVEHPLTVSRRPHPSGSGGSKWLEPRFRLDEHGSVVDALAAADLAICGAHSSVALEAACLGVLTLLVGNPSALMTNPAEGIPGVVLLLTPRHLIETVDRIVGAPITTGSSTHKMFHLDDQLPRWRAVLSEGQNWMEGPAGN